MELDKEYQTPCVTQNKPNKKQLPGKRKKPVCSYIFYELNLGQFCYFSVFTGKMKKLELKEN